MSMTTFTAPPNAPATTNSTASTVVITDDGMGAMTIVRTPVDGGPPCTLHSHLGADRKSSTLDAGQTCTTETGDIVSYTMGGSTLTATDAYTSSSSWTISGQTKTGAPLMGTGTGSATCGQMLQR
jgi:hypothetical protein